MIVPGLLSDLIPPSSLNSRGEPKVYLYFVEFTRTYSRSRKDSQLRWRWKAEGSSCGNLKTSVGTKERVLGMGLCFVSIM